ncbi:unnamed protein product [Cylicostephanus goldi]|uniref:VWFA domain-containing protein n=1 Tax=Cylicostephanus goldi TaxID=71465 RepID=A0A3P6R3D7_CYLGO|nr:unnamed protein product [Cylicostephanus goldi]
MFRALVAANKLLNNGRKQKLRKNVKTVILIYASNYRDKDFNDARELAEEIRRNGTDIMAVAFDQGGKIDALERMVEIASPGHFFTSRLLYLSRSIKQALCEVNCFCKSSWHHYTALIGRKIRKYGVCLQIGEKNANWMSVSDCGRIFQGKNCHGSGPNSPEYGFLARKDKFCILSFDRQRR